jgi:hypothetical protein
MPKIPESPSDIVVTDSEVRSARNLKGTTDAMRNLYGDNWGDEEVRLFIQEKRFEKFQEQLVDEAKSQKRYKRYAGAFENLTPNDEQTILAMCVNEEQQERLAETLASTKITVGNADEIKKLHKVLTDLTTEHRQLQKALGIQRQDRKSEKQTALDLVRTEIDHAREFMEERLITITHEGCNIQIGWVLNNFQELPYRCQFTCPRCGGDIIIEGGDPEETKKVFERMREQGGQRQD